METGEGWRRHQNRGAAGGAGDRLLPSLQPGPQAILEVNFKQRKR